PEDASRRVADAERAQAVAQERLALRQAEAHRIAGVLAGIDIDEPVLAAGDEIEQLESLRHQYGAYADDIARAQGKAGLLWTEVAQAARELGWEAEPVT